MVDETQMSINHTAQTLPVITNGEYNCLEIGEKLIHEKIRNCATECGVYNYDEFLWKGSSYLSFYDVQNLKYELEEYYIRIILIRLFNFDINNGKIEDLLKIKNLFHFN